MKFTVDQIIQWVGATVANREELGDHLGEIQVEGVGALRSSQSDQIAYFFSESYKDQLPTAQAGVLITAEPFVEPMRAAGLPWWNTTAVLVCENPYWAMAKISEELAPHLASFGPPREFSETSVHPSASVHESVELGQGVQVGANVVIEAGAKIGAHTQIFPGVYVGPRTKIGSLGQLFANVVIYENVEIGDRVRIHGGAVVGSDGLGFAPVIQDGKPTAHQKIYHFGRVIIGDDVEIGSNATIDRGTIEDTVLESQVKLDNDVHIGHNAKVFLGGIICGGTALAGRAKVGRFAYVGGVTGVTNDVLVGDGAKVGAGAVLTKDIPPGGTGVGNPQRTHSEHFRAHAALNKLIKKRK